MNTLDALDADSLRSDIPDVRRAKLYYLRDLRGKAAKIKEKRDIISR